MLITELNPRSLEIRGLSPWPPGELHLKMYQARGIHLSCGVPGKAIHRKVLGNPISNLNPNASVSSLLLPWGHPAVLSSIPATPFLETLRQGVLLGLFSHLFSGHSFSDSLERGCSPVSVFIPLLSRHSGPP